MRVCECERCELRLDRDANAATCVLVRAFGDEARWGGATPFDLASTPPPVGDPRRRQSSQMERQ